MDEVWEEDHPEQGVREEEAPLVEVGHEAQALTFLFQELTVVQKDAAELAQHSHVSDGRKAKPGKGGSEEARESEDMVPLELLLSPSQVWDKVTEGYVIHAEV